VERKSPDRYLKWAHAFVVVYSITSRSSYDEARAYLDTIAQYQHITGKDIPVAVVGNKMDLERYRSVRRQADCGVCRDVMGGYRVDDTSPERAVAGLSPAGRVTGSIPTLTDCASVSIGITAAVIIAARTCSPLLQMYNIAWPVCVRFAEGLTRVGPRNHALDADLESPPNGHFERERVHNSAWTVWLVAALLQPLVTYY